MVRVFVLYEREPDPERYARHVEEREQCRGLEDHGRAPLTR